MKPTLHAALVALCTIGCDDRPELPKIETETSTASTKPAGPTTQELLSGERKALSLGYIPFRLNVPPGWSVEMDGIGGMAFLKGPTPTAAEVQIHLTPRPTQTKEQLEYLIDGAKKDAAKNPESTKKLDLRHMGDVTVLERQSIGQPISFPGDVNVTDTSPEYRWTINLFVPRRDSKGFAQYEMNFLGLTVNRFDADRAFLESILSTLQLDTPQAQ